MEPSSNFLLLLFFFFTALTEELIKVTQNVYYPLSIEVFKEAELPVSEILILWKVT